MNLPRIAIAFLLLTGAVAAETFQLRSGGRLHGKLLNPNETPRSTYQIRLLTGGDITLDAKDVKGVDSPTDDQVRYHDLLKQMPADTAENHWRVAEAAREWSLPRERTFHLQQVIRLDPDHEQARRALKYKKLDDGSWAKPEDIKKAAGLVRRDGRWLTEQAAELEEASEANEAAKIEWQKKLKMWRGWLGDRRRRGKALELIGSIDDPLAAEAVAKLFWAERNVGLREALAEVLGRLESSRATRTLAKAALEADTEMRFHCVRQLEKNGRRSVVSWFIPALSSQSNVTVRRAAYAIGELGDDSAVLPLIKALQTTHTYKTGGSGGGINASFDPTGRRGGGLSMGGNRPKTFTKTHANREVRNALLRLTDQDFEYDENRWMAWYLARTTPPALDLRRDP